MINIEQYIRDVPNFPKQGILFKDITPLLNNAQASQDCLQKLVSLTKNLGAHKIVGVEARGFFFGTLLAKELNIGFVPVRKPGKLPYKTLKQTYALEYGEDVLEIHLDAINKGDKVIVHDDVLATGGTAQAVCKLVEQLGGVVVQCNFLMQLNALEGYKKLEKYNIVSILKY